VESAAFFAGVLDAPGPVPASAAGAGLKPDQYISSAPSATARKPQTLIFIAS